jgi:hypothetical protein
MGEVRMKISQRTKDIIMITLAASAFFLVNYMDYQDELAIEQHKESLK